MSTIISLSPWASFWSMGKNIGTSVGFAAVEALRKINSEVMHFVKAGSPCDEGSIPIPVHRGSVPRWTYPILMRLGSLGQYCFAKLRARRWIQHNGKFYNAVMAELQKQKIDRVQLVYCHSAEFVECGRRLGIAFKCPVVSHFYGTFLGHCKSRRDAFLQSPGEYLGWTTPVDLRVCLDDGTMGLEVRDLLGLSLENFLFQPHGLDVKKLNSSFDPALTRDLLSENSHFIMTASRLANWKRVDRLLRAMPTVTEKIKNVRLLLFGDGPERKRLEDLSKELGISKWVRFMGAVTQETVFAFMKKCEIFVSTNDFSNLSEGLKQAMYMGMCVVATDSGDTKQLIKQNVTGKLVLCDDTASLAETLIDLIEYPALRWRLGHSAKAFIEKHEPTSEAVMAERIAAITSLIDRYGGS